MASDTKDKSTAESLRSTRTYGKCRCMNPTCMERLEPKPGEDVVTCPTCGSKWRIFWIKAGFPRVRGPVWEHNKKLAEETLAKKMKEGK